MVKNKWELLMMNSNCIRLVLVPVPVIVGSWLILHVAAPPYYSSSCELHHNLSLLFILCHKYNTRSPSQLANKLASASFDFWRIAFKNFLARSGPLSYLTSTILCWPNTRRPFDDYILISCTAEIWSLFLEERGS